MLSYPGGAEASLLQASKSPDVHHYDSEILSVPRERPIEGMGTERERECERLLLGEEKMWSLKRSHGMKMSLYEVF